MGNYLRLIDGFEPKPTGISEIVIEPIELIDTEPIIIQELTELQGEQ